MKIPIFATCSLVALALHAATVDRMIVRQQWPWNGSVRVEYILSGASVPQDVAVSISQDGTAVDVSSVDGRTFLVGDLHGVGDGAHAFTIDAAQLPASVRRDADVTVELSLSDSPANAREAIYMIIDLVNASNVTYVTRADLLDGKYGTYETSYSAFDANFSTPVSDVLVWTGVTNDVKYMTTHMVLRKIPAANRTFTLGAPDTWLTRNGSGRDDLHKVKLTSDFWIGVFEVTQSQYARMGVSAVTHHFTNPDCAATRPAEMVRYIDVRGSNLGSKWGDNSVAVGRQVDANTWFDVFRRRTGLERLDLPSDAQWEIACMAEQDKVPLYSGERYEKTSFTSNPKDANVDKLARYKWNGGYADVKDDTATEPAADCDTSRGTAKVGSYAPNAYGLYDMLGNVSEWALDYMPANAGYEGVKVNPVGVVLADSYQGKGRRSRRGGRWSEGISSVATRFTPQASYAQAAGESSIGLRVCYTEHDDEPYTEEE